MPYIAIKVGSFCRLFLGGIWQLRKILGVLLLVLALDSALMIWSGNTPGKDVRQVVGWFFGNGSRVDDLPWAQLACCIFAAVCGYVFLGIVLSVTVKAFEHADG